MLATAIITVVTKKWRLDYRGFSKSLGKQRQLSVILRCRNVTENPS